jgi:hypothetical protein
MQNNGHVPQTIILYIWKSLANKKKRQASEHFLKHMIVPSEKYNNTSM